MRRLMLVLAAVLLSGFALLSEGTAASAAASAHGFVLKGATAGHVRLAEPGQSVTFVFTESDIGSVARSEDLILESFTHSSITAANCVLPDGSVINDDGWDCEPGFLHHGQHASSVITAKIRGSTGEKVTFRVCLGDESSGAVGPCHSVSVRIA